MARRNGASTDRPPHATTLSSLDAAGPRGPIRQALAVGADLGLVADAAFIVSPISAISFFR
jgi:hypothetical protein